MSDKRFYELASSIDYYQIWDKQEDKGYTIEDAVDKLNSLAEENEEYAKIIYENGLWVRFTILEKENEQLRQKLDSYLLDEFEWKEKYGD